MRFEIGPGGMFVVLLGLLGLSGAVFGLGLIAGHELAGPEQTTQPVATAYPLPAAPAEPEEPSASTAPAPGVASNTESPTAPPAETTGEASAPVAAAAAPPASPPAVTTAKAPKAPAASTRKAAAQVASRGPRKPPVSEEDEDLAPGSAVAPPPSSSSSEPAGTEDTGDEEEETTSRPAPVQPPAHKRLAAVNPSASSASSTAGHPYSIQIDAMMDYQGAQQMAQKLRAKGFQPYMVPTQLGGKTWYRLRVGHYATPADAQAAEAKLHQEFNDTPSGR